MPAHIAFETNFLIGCVEYFVEISTIRKSDYFPDNNLTAVKCDHHILPNVNELYFLINGICINLRVELRSSQG